MRTITLYITALFWVICGITPISSMEEMEAQEKAPTKKATPDGKIDRDEHLYECAKNLQCCLSDDEQLSHIFWVRMFEARLRNAKERGDEKEYKQLLLLKMKTVYSLPSANFPDGFLFSAEQVGQALDTLGVFNIEAIDLGKFFPFVGGCIETFDPLLLETENILNAYVLHGENVLKQWEYKIEEEAHNLIAVSFHLLNQKGNQSASASNRDFSESVPGVGLDFLKAPMGSPSFHVEPVIEIIGNRGMPIAKLSEALLPLGTIDLFERLCRGLKTGKTKSFSLGGQSASAKICQELQNNLEYDLRAETFEIIDTLVALEFAYQLHQIILRDNFKAPLVPKEKGLNVSMGEKEEDLLRRHGRSLYPIFTDSFSINALEEEKEALKKKIAALHEEVENLQRQTDNILENIVIENEKSKKEESDRIKVLEENKRKAEREIEDLRVQLKNLQQQTNEILSDIAIEGEKNEKAESDRIKALEEEKKNKEREIEDLHAQLKNLQQKTNEILSDIAMVNEKRKKEDLDRIKVLEENKRNADQEIEDLRGELKNLQRQTDNILSDIAIEGEKNKKAESDRIKGLEEGKRNLELKINNLELEMKRIEDEKNKKAESNRAKVLEEDKRKLELKIEGIEAKMKDLLMRLEKKEKTLAKHERIARYNIWAGEDLQPSPTMVDVDKTRESPYMVLKHRDGRSIEVIPTKKESSPQ